MVCLAMDEAERIIGLSFDEWLYKADVVNRIAAKPLIKKPQESAVDDYSVLTTTSAPIVTAESFIDVLRELERNTPPPDGYTYILPSPNEGKRLLIHGWIYPGTASEMAWQIWQGKATVDDFPEMTEIDLW